MSVRDLLLQSCRVDTDGIVTVVVYDQNTDKPAKLATDSFLVVLMSKLLITFSKVYFMRGGYLQFQNQYPNLSESNSPISPLLTSVSLPVQSSHSPDTPATRVLSFLYLGSQADAMNKDFLQVCSFHYLSLAYCHVFLESMYYSCAQCICPLSTKSSCP